MSDAADYELDVGRLMSYAIEGHTFEHYLSAQEVPVWAHAAARRWWDSTIETMARARAAGGYVAPVYDYAETVPRPYCPRCGRQLDDDGDCSGCFECAVCGAEHIGSSGYTELCEDCAADPLNT